MNAENNDEKQKKLKKDILANFSESNWPKNKTKNKIESN